MNGQSGADQEAAQAPWRPSNHTPDATQPPGAQICSAETTFAIVLCAAKPTATVEMEPKARIGCRLTPKLAALASTAATTMA